MSTSMILPNTALNHDWVRGQAECLLPGLFAKLAERVRRDMEEARRFSPLKDLGFTFTLPPEPEKIKSSFAVTRKPPPNSSSFDATVEFVRNGKDIRVDCHQGESFRVTAHWNPKTGNCDLKIDGKLSLDNTPHELWQVSQKALLPLMFPNEDDEVFRGP